MKKFIMAVSAVAMVLGMSSCGNNASKTEENKATEPEKVIEVPKSFAEINAEQGAAFLDSLKQNDPDVKFTESGLGYRVVKEGKGNKPAPTSVAKVNYTGKHIDGVIFDSSNGNPIEFPLNGVIPGFSEGLQLMSPGAEYVLYIPSALAYGERGAGGAIGPNETLIFDLELIDFK